MTLPATGPLLASMINVELGRASNAKFHLNGTDERRLARVPTGPIGFSDFYGKSRGFPTPDADYPDPNTVTKTATWVAPSLTIVSSVTFNVDGTITASGTMTTPLPPRWYQDGTPPPGYQALFNPVSSSFSGGVDAWSYTPPTGQWFPMTHDFPAFVQLGSTGAITQTTTATAVIDVTISTGSAVVATFRLNCVATLT